MMGSESETCSPSLECLPSHVLLVYRNERCGRSQEIVEAATARSIAGRMEVCGYLHGERRSGCDNIWRWPRWQGRLWRVGG
jgi:hypothetical protein